MDDGIDIGIGLGFCFIVSLETRLCRVEHTRAKLEWLHAMAQYSNVGPPTGGPTT